MPGLRSNLTALGLMLLIFVAGAVVGIVADRIWMAHHGAPAEGCALAGSVLHEHKLQAFRIHLDLTDAQANEIGEIVKRTSEEIHAVRESCHPKVHQAHMRAQQQIMEVLSEEQRAKYEKMITHTRHPHHGGHGDHGE